MAWSDRFGLKVVADLGDENLVDLDLVEWKRLKIVPSPEAGNVPEQQAVIRPKHAEPMAHIVERGVQFLHHRGGVLVRPRRWRIGAGESPAAGQRSQQRREGERNAVADRDHTLLRGGAPRARLSAYARTTQNARGPSANASPAP